MRSQDQASDIATAGRIDRYLLAVESAGAAT